MWLILISNYYVLIFILHLLLCLLAIAFAVGGRYTSLWVPMPLSEGTCSPMPKWFEIIAESKKELEQWDVEFDSKLFRMGERVLLDEEMVQKNEEY